MPAPASRRAFSRLLTTLRTPSTHRRAFSSIPARQQQQQQQPQPATTPSPQTAAQVQHDLSPSDESQPLRSLTEGLSDPPPILSEDEKQVDWTRSFHGLSSSPFTPEQSDILQQRLDFDDIEIKPDGIVYLPEIKYRRILNRAFGPGGWGLAPRGETIVTGKVVTREYGLVCGGRLVSIARGEQTYFDPDGIPTATEGCKSNALMRCCKDLGIASELWDPRFIKKFMAEMGKETMVEHAATKKRRKHWMRKGDEVKYPFKDIGMPGAGTGGSGNGGGGVAAQAGRAYRTTTKTAEKTAEKK
ncbi:hypothetical protein M409DRAFT_67135 [Zasmidium cellare ATCC 36951]|uniref:Mitochondrial genome maintenance protein MGM101 n=1 Tax=Zasmidium cellare ATCC 36951 TaxID=1080233 RepID=A0A6A6CJC6_ZASCE|nr:uncharacterized protein M409DRAFT_67135 [Zasmidium cellare ATCC 36951]KAF2165809.1 hypothetical protein M409DRAFT_67135 [Zasmidium cellare ATCC 36951]